MSLEQFFEEVKNTFEDKEKRPWTSLRNPAILDDRHALGGRALRFEPSIWTWLRLSIYGTRIRSAQRDDFARGPEKYHVLNRSTNPLGENRDLAPSKPQTIQSDSIFAPALEKFLPWERRTPHGIATDIYADIGTVSEALSNKVHAFWTLRRSLKPLDLDTISELARKHKILVDVMPRLIEDESGNERLFVSVEPVKGPHSGVRRIFE